MNALAARPSALPSDIAWSSQADAATPKLGIYPNKNSNPRMSFTASSSTVALTVAMLFQGTTRMANGSRIKLTDTNLESYSVTAGTLPPEIDPTVWYYWKELTSTTGQLCTDAALLLPVIPSTTVANKYYWVVPANTLPADNSGSGTYNGGTGIGGDSRIGVKLGTMRLCQAMGMADDANGDVTDAIANCAAIFDNIPGQTGYADRMQYGWDNSL
jgi:hypothetical protein